MYIIPQVPRYDNRCRHLSSEEIKEKMKKDTPHCIRFKVSLMTLKRYLN